ncbi:hypothetical protein [Chlamydia vaughanii]|uniref:hypothetical protein n=1 Tax=Chlamydia vaughanii TaxID=3112552 RepID=UPI0032B17BC9
MKNVNIIQPCEYSTFSPDLPIQKSQACRILHIVIIVISSLAIVGSIVASVTSGILPLLSVCGIAAALLLISILSMKRSCPRTKEPVKIDKASIPEELPFLLEVNEATPHVKVLERCAERVTDWTNLENIYEDSTSSLLLDAWKFKNSKTILFATTGAIYTPRIPCCCNLMIAIDHALRSSDLEALNIFDQIPEGLPEGQCRSLPWTNSDGSTNQPKIGLPNFLGFIHGPNPVTHQHNAVVAYAIAKTAYTNCIKEALDQKADMIQLPLVSISPSQTSKNPRASAAWKAAIQTGLVAAVAHFAIAQPQTPMNIVVVGPTGLGLPL